MTDIFLFDIDLTMIRTNGAGSAAMDITIHEMLGVAGAFTGMQFAGRTDRALLREALTRCGRMNGAFDAFCTEFEERYLSHLERELRARRGVVLPGVQETLAAVSARPDTRLGLATGNFRRAAEIKLRHFRLWEHFASGGFAEDGEDRADLVAVAVTRLTEGVERVGSIVVIGDSAHDIAAAKANGLIAVGVCTGDCDQDTLRAAGADHVLDDLSEPITLLRLLTGRGE